MSTTLDNLANFVTAKQADPEFINSNDKESATLNKLLENKKVKGGALQNFSIKNDSQTTNFKWMLPDDTSDVVGTGSDNDYQSISPVAQPQFTWSFGTTNLSYSGVQLQQAKTGGKSQLADYLGDRLAYTNSEMITQLGSGIISGTGGGLQAAIEAGGTGPVPGPAASVAAEPYGLIYQDRYFSGIANGNTAGTASVTRNNTHFGKERHLYGTLVGNVFDASSAGYGTTISVTGATLTNGSTELSVMTSDVYTDYIGWEVWADITQSGTFVRLGREFVIADAATGAATTCQMSQIYRGATDTAVDIELRAPYSTAVHGTAGITNPEKLNKAYFAASDGTNHPDMGMMNSDMFAAVYNDLFGVRRWTAVTDSDYETKGYDNFKFHRSTMVLDNNCISGEIHFINTKYTKIYCLEGMTDYKIQGKDMISLPHQNGFEQYGAAKVFPFQVVSISPRNNARVIGLEY